MIVINSQELPEINDESCEDFQYRWKRRTMQDDGTWNAWTSVGESYNEANLTVPAEFTRTVQFRREVRGVTCDCDVFTDWDYSNVVTLYVVDHIAAAIDPAGDKVCWDDAIAISGTPDDLQLPIYNDYGDPTGDYFFYVDGAWSGDEEIVSPKVRLVLTPTQSPLQNPVHSK